MACLVSSGVSSRCSPTASLSRVQAPSAKRVYRHAWGDGLKPCSAQGPSCRPFNFAGAPVEVRFSDDQTRVYRLAELAAETDRTKSFQLRLALA